MQALSFVAQLTALLLHDWIALCAIGYGEWAGYRTTQASGSVWKIGKVVVAVVLDRLTLLRAFSREPPSQPPATLAVTQGITVLSCMQPLSEH